MALRQIGTSLVAKATPGSLQREQKEREVEQGRTPIEGQPGSLTREFISEPIEKRVPPGSEKITTAQPTIQAKSNLPLDLGPAEPTEGAPGIGLQPGVVAPVTASAPDVGILPPAGPGGQTQFGSQTPAMAASSQSAGGRVARSVSGGELPGGQITPTAASTGSMDRVIAPVQVRAEQPIDQPGYELTRGLFGRKSFADEGGQMPQALEPLIRQQVSGAVGKILDVLGQATGNILPERGISERLERYGGAPGVAISQRGTASGENDFLRSLATGVGRQVSNLRSAASSGLDRLRSWFR